MTDLREIDAALAQRLFGLPVIEWNEDTPCPECGAEMHYCGQRSRCTNCNEWRYQAYRECSATWEGAGLVVEKMLERGWWVTIANTHSGWSVEFHDITKPDPQFGFACTAKTMSEACARAALAALDAAKEGETDA